MKRRAHQPVLITSAARSQEDQLRTRTVRYVAMMSIRIVCLVLAVVLVSVNAPLLWLWLGLCALGMILIPWVAVVLANDRLPKERHRMRRPGRRSGRSLDAGRIPLPPPAEHEHARHEEQARHEERAERQGG